MVNASDDEIEHLYELIRVHTRYLRIQEKNIATLGVYCPPHIVMEIEDRRRVISELKQKVNRRLLHTDDTETFYSSEAVDEIYDRISEVFQNREEIKQLEAMKSIIEEDYQAGAMFSSVKPNTINSTLFQLFLVVLFPSLGTLAWYFFDRARSFENL